MKPVDPQQQQWDWVEHLEELRRSLFVIAGALALATVVSLFFSDWLIHLLTGPMRALEERLYFVAPYEALLVKLKVSLFAGILLASPVAAGQIWRFVAPGLYESEKRSALFAAGWTAACFVAGVAFAFFAVLPFALRFFLGFQTEELQPLISIHEYISFLTGFLLGFGAAFVFPVFLLILVKLGLLRAETLARQRRLALLVIFIAAAILTPSTDVVSQILLAIPLAVLFEATVFLARRMGRQPGREENIL